MRPTHPTDPAPTCENLLQAAFLRNVNHEIRTPLNIIVGHAEQLLDLGWATDVEVERSLRAILRASKQLERALRAISDLSRIEAGAFHIDKRPVQLSKLFQLELPENAMIAEQKGLRLICDIADPALTVSVDEYCLKHSLDNLLDNAIKFTERGSVTIRAYREIGGPICVDIADTGIGINNKYLEQLFEPFSQENMEMTRLYPGMGLGLALAHRYLALNEAQIIVDSTVGRGSIFTIRFPNEESCAGTRGFEAQT